MRGIRKTTTRHFRAFIGAIAISAAAAVPTTVYAFDWYGGASVGKNRYQVTGGDYFPFQTFSGGADGNDSAWKAFVGMRLFDKYVAAEFGYIDLGKASVKGTVSGSPVASSSKTKAYTAALVGDIPVGTRLGVLIKLGLAAPRATITTTTGTGPNTHTSDLKVFGGMGAQFDITKTISGRIEYERFNQGSLGPSYANVLSVGFTYQFYTE